MIDVVIIEPLAKPYKRSIENTLESFQDIVEGYIEVIPFGQFLLVVNEQGQFSGNLKPCRIIGKAIIKGNIIVCKQEGDEFASLDEAEANAIIAKFSPMRI